jgi:peptide/nickel transport system substrate-binding protein
MPDKKATVSRRSFLKLSALAATSALLQACAQRAAPTPSAATAAPTRPPSATPGPVRGGAFTTVSFVDAVSMQPLINSDAASGYYISLVYGALLRRDPKTLAYIGDMAEGFTFSEDGLTLTIKLRKELKWSDGKPITAADFVFNYAKMMDEKVNCPYRSTYQQYYESLTAVDDDTLAWKLKKLFCPAIDWANLRPIPKHVFETLDINQNEFNNKPTVFSGPFKLQEWVKDSHAIFVANDSYYRGRPYLDKLICKIVKDNTVATAMFKTQEVDMCGPDPVNWAEIKALPHAQALEFYPLSALWHYIGFKLDHPLFSDVKVRQALSYALDKVKIIEKIRLGYARLQHSFVHAANWAYTDDLPKYEYNVEKAKPLMKEAGWVAGSDGVLVKDGKSFKCRIHYTAGNVQHEQTCIIAQQYFKDIGVSVEVIAEEWNAYLQRITKARDFDMFALSWMSGGDPHGQANIWGTGKGQNNIAYSNKRVDELKKLYIEAQRLIAEDAGYIFLYTQQNLVAVNNRFVINPVTALGFDYDMQLWYSKTGK